MSIRKSLLTGLAAAAVALSVGAGSAMASPRSGPHFEHANAAVELLGGGQEQWAAVNAVSPGRFRGAVDYTNFSLPGFSRVWSIDTHHSDLLTVVANGNTYLHTLNAGEVLAALSDHSVNFTGTGYYNPVPAIDTWTIAGNITGRNVTFTITYGPWAVPTYTASFQGQIALNGSASGTFKDVNNTTGTWSLPARTFFTAVHFTAPILRDQIKVDLRHHTADADVLFRIPFGSPLRGALVDWNFGTVNGHKFWLQSLNGGHLFPETVESGVIAIS
jgi:hypothetical protein